MNLYSKARKHIDMKRVKEMREEKIKERIEQIALQEQEYLLHFTQNVVPKHYDWRTGKFNEKSLEEINKIVLDRLEKIDNALSEGMSSKDFKYLYGGVLTYDIVSVNPTAVSSTFAQDLIGASNELTSHMFGPNFPGSHINSIGDFSPQSYSKVDVLATASWNSIQDVTPSGWTPENSYEYVDSVSDVVTPGQESDVFKDTLFGEVTVTGTNFSLSTGDDEDSSQENTVDIADLRTLFPGVTFPTAFPMPGETEREPPQEASMLLRTFKSIKVGQEITFNYSFTSTETEEDDDVTYRGVSGTSVPGDDGIMDDYAFVLIGGKVQKIVSVMARDGNNINFNFQPNADDDYKPDVLQSRFPLTGRYRYTVKSDDIDDYGNLKLFVGVMDSGDSAYESNLDVTNVKLDSSRLDVGQLKKTTDAYNLGTSVASLNPNKKKKEDRKEDRKKKKNTFAERWGLPNDYQDRFRKAHGYFINNIGKINVPMGLGFATMGVAEKVDELFDKSLAKQGFSEKQIETIKKNKLLKFTSKRVKSDYDRTVERWEKEREEREKRRKQEYDRRPKIGVQPGGGGTRDIGMPKQKSRFGGTRDIGIPKQKNRIGVQPGGGGTRDIGMPKRKTRIGFQSGGGGTRDIGKGGRSINPNLIGRGLRSATDQIRYGGKMMFQGNPAGRAPGLSNYWSPDPKTAATYTNPGKGKGIPGRGPNPTGTLTTARRPPGTPRVTRGITGTPQFKFPKGSPPPSKMITQMADDAAVGIARRTAATKASKFLGRAVPVAGAAIAFADAGVRASKGDYAGAVLSVVSAIPGPAGWAALGTQIATDAAGFTGGVKEQQEFDNYGDYIKGAAKIAKKDKIKIDRNAMLDLFLRELSKDNKLSNKDKEFLVAIFTDAEGLEKDDVITFVKKIQKKLMDGKSIEEQLYPGQPSPNGFPDTPPPQLAPNGYHPEFGKRSNRYRRLDPISAKTMDKVGTDDPETNKQVAASAADSKPKKLPSGAAKKYARRNVVKKESNNLYTRSTKYIDMKRVKELREEKIKEQRASKIVERQLENVAELKEIEKPVDWRRDLEEGMTTSGLGMINYRPEGDVDIVDNETALSTLFAPYGAVSGGTVTVTDDGTNDIVNGTHTAYRTVFYYVDGSASSHAKITISKGGGVTSWYDRDRTWTDAVHFIIADNDDLLAPLYFDEDLPPGTHLIPLPSNYKNLRISFEQFAKVGETGALTISNVSLQRRTPVNVFVSLDDPEANSFIRDGSKDKLSPAEKKKKLEQQLKSSEEYLNKMFGGGMPKGATELADYEPQPSFVDMMGQRSGSFAQQYGLPDDYKDRLSRAAGYFTNNVGNIYRSTGLGIPDSSVRKTNELLVKSLEDQGFSSKQIETIQKNKLLRFDSKRVKGAYDRAIERQERESKQRERERRAQQALQRKVNQIRSTRSQSTPTTKRTSARSTQKPFSSIRVGDTKPTSRSTYNPGKDYGQIAGVPRNSPGEGAVPAYPSPRGPYTPIRNYGTDKNPKFFPSGPPITPYRLAKKRTMVAHHEPQGEVISERKKLKSPKELVDKIPGYYDGKPSPLGFPIEEPPKMKDGFHPDLVDGKKVANRFNRLDPISAKATPPTGNPHIDKKVRAATKKPK